LTDQRAPAESLADTIRSMDPCSPEERAGIAQTARYSSAAEAAVGQGGGGTVLATRDALLRRRIAVKRLVTGDEDDFVREARIAAQLDHPAIVPVYDLFRDGAGTLCVAMRLVEGESLAARLARCATLEARLALLTVVLQVAQALAYAHRRGVAHLDLKPQNVMVGADGQTSVVDWGLARTVAHTKEAVDVSSGLAVGSAGTPAYWSPEQARGEAVDRRADAWGLGAVLFELLTGTPPWSGPTLVETIHAARHDAPPRVEGRCPDAPPGLAAICHKALRRAPEERYPSAIEFAADLEAWFEGRAISARRRSWRELLVGFLRRHPWPVAAVTFAVACALVSAGVAGARVREERDEARRLSRVFGQAASRGIEPRPENEPLLQAYTEATERAFTRLGADVIDADRVDLALARDRLARIHMRTAKYALARGEAERAVALAQPIVSAHPDDAAAQEAYVGALMTLGAIALAEGRSEELLALRARALSAIDAAPQRDSSERIWLELRALALVDWLYGQGERSEVPEARVQEAAALSARAAIDERVHRRTAMVLDTWLAEERWRRGELAEARRHVGLLDAAARALLSSDPAPPLEARGLAVYGLTIAGVLSAWSTQPQEAAAYLERAARVAAQVDLESKASWGIATERDRAWLMQGRLAEARADLRRLSGWEAPVGSIERWATLLLGEPLGARPATPEDALDAFTLGLAAAREGRLEDAARLVEEARARGLARQLFCVPGQMALATTGVPAELGPAAADFARRWDEASSRGDPRALTAALDALAAAFAAAAR
jgi:tetratricopeptide (TPR) repeat protein